MNNLILVSFCYVEVVIGKFLLCGGGYMVIGKFLPCGGD